jgi:sulfide:quinone oxidoreductase
MGCVLNPIYPTVPPVQKFLRSRPYVQPLMDVLQRKDIVLKTKHNLKEIRGESKEAVFEVTTDEGSTAVTLPYDILHVAPLMSAPDFFKNSPLGVEGSGDLVDVHKHTLQHNRYPNIFSLGDASSLPTSCSTLGLLESDVRREATRRRINSQVVKSVTV